MENALKAWTPAPESDLALDPCPFCGSRDVSYEKYQHPAGERWRVVCYGCMANIDPGYCQQPGQVQPLWNRRTAVKENDTPPGVHYKNFMEG